MDSTGIEIGVAAVAGAVDQLVRHHDRARPEFGVRLPTAHGPNTRRTPSARSAHMFARYGTVCGEYWWLRPCRGRKATSWVPTRPTVIRALGSPYGVSRLRLRASDPKNE